LAEGGKYNSRSMLKLLVESERKGLARYSARGEKPMKGLPKSQERKTAELDSPIKFRRHRRIVTAIVHRHPNKKGACLRQVPAR
jgi:sensor domain CHASE-containing protein